MVWTGAHDGAGSSAPAVAASPSRAPAVRVAGLTKRFGSVTALDGVSLDVRDGEFLCLLGPSGCGKSTLLRVIAGFEAPDEGRVEIDGRDASADPPHRRPLNMMFQSYALFPHMNLARNVGYGLRWSALPKREAAARVDEMLRLVRLEGLGDRMPHQVSGGQRQRAALARALARRPRVLLLDEPLGALDARLREETGAELKSLQARLGTTFVVVTHDGTEAMTLGDRIAVFGDGRLLQVDTPRRVYERPVDGFVARFLGDVNLVAGVVTGIVPGGIRIATPLAPEPLLVVSDEPGRWSLGVSATLAIRPEAIRILPGQVAGEIRNVLSGRLEGSDFAGHATCHRVRVGDGYILRVTSLGGDAGPAGSTVRLAVPADGIALLD